MRIEGRLVDEALLNLPDVAVGGLVNLERDTSPLGLRQFDVTRQVPQDSSHLVIARTDQLPAKHDLRCHLLKHDIRDAEAILLLAQPLSNGHPIHSEVLREIDFSHTFGVRRDSGNSGGI